MKTNHIERVHGTEEGIDFDAHYRVKNYHKITFYLLGWETEPDEDTEWSGNENRTGNIVAVMVGDDRKHVVEKDDLILIEDDKFCRSCGQIGCGCNVYA